jgi:hypothetical protein
MNDTFTLHTYQNLILGTQVYELRELPKSEIKPELLCKQLAQIKLESMAIKQLVNNIWYS